MVRKTFLSLDHELQVVGYLSLTKSLQWLKQYHPHKKISYPTALKLIQEGKLCTMKDHYKHQLTRQMLEAYINGQVYVDKIVQPLSLTQLKGKQYE